MFIRAMALVAPLTMITGCVTAIDAGPAAVGSATSANRSLVVSGTFLPYHEGATAITYDETVVPAGSTARVAIMTTEAGMRVELTTTGMVPRRSYGAHLHTQPCTAVPDQAGPHYQHMHDPMTPSVDPDYANPRNEIWLDFTADAAGAASATSAPEWAFPDGSSARSLVVHTQQTRTSSGEAGTAGARVACLTLPAV